MHVCPFTLFCVVPVSTCATASSLKCTYACAYMSCFTGALRCSRSMPSCSIRLLFNAKLLSCPAVSLSLSLSLLPSLSPSWTLPLSLSHVLDKHTNLCSVNTRLDHVLVEHNLVITFCAQKTQDHVFVKHNNLC
jgi:hypothetical protein